MADGVERTWSGRVDTWHHHVTNSPAFDKLREEVIGRAAVTRDDRCVDLGAGTGFLTLPLARLAGHVIAVDIAPAMTEELARRVADEELTNVDVIAADLADLRVQPGSLDVVVSSYALHHVTHPQKRQIAARAREWLRPGGRLVVADMMFGRGFSPGDREVLAAKVKALAAKGPGGIWRIAKNVTRLGLRVGDEMPAPPDFWVRAVTDAGFTDVEHLQVVQEAGIVSGRVPG